MPKISEERRTARRDQILDAAERCFVARGFRATSTADIVTESGLSIGAIYGYFASKDDLAVAVARRAMLRRRDELEALIARDELPPPSGLLRLVADAIDRGQLDPVLLVQLWGEATVGEELRVIATDPENGLAGALGRYLRRWAREGRRMPDDEVEPWATAVLPAVQGLHQGYLLQRALLGREESEGYLRGIEVLLA